MKEKFGAHFGNNIGNNAGKQREEAKKVGLGQVLKVQERLWGKKKSKKEISRKLISIRNISKETKKKNPQTKGI